MSYAHTQRRKLIKSIKREFPKNWYKVFRDKVDADVKERLGLGITLEDLKEESENNH